MFGNLRLIEMSPCPPSCAVEFPRSIGTFWKVLLAPLRSESPQDFFAPDLWTGMV